MDIQQTQKPTVEEWVYWAEVVIDRLTDCVRVYKHPPHVDVFVADSERQQKTAMSTDLLRRIYALVDQAETPSDSITGAHIHDEQIIDGLGVLFREMLLTLPMLSSDMQMMLKSSWFKNFPNKIAQDLFFGENDDETRGIGSGHSEHGRLPEAMTQLMEREQAGDTRYPREELLRHGEPRRHDIEARQRWSEQNSGFLRMAGRVE
ncbi:MAG: hypothetical protein KGI97_03755 [Alphaproteobacteria bacterium]|nr:hypothetical protein [Alphaproteobacteria bacterium]